MQSCHVPSRKLVTRDVVRWHDVAVDSSGGDEAAELVEELGLVGIRSAQNLMTLRDGIKAGEPWVVLVGAGLSADAEIPTWDGLARVAAAAVGYETEVVSFAANALPTFFEECLNKATGDGDPSVFWEAIANEVCKGDPTEAHDLLIEVPFEAYLTLNFDCLLTRRHEQLVGVPDPRVMVYPDLKPTKVGARRLVHLHGACRDCEPRLDPMSVVLTEAGYREAYSHTSLDLLIQTVFTDFRVLAIGTTFGDPKIEHLVRRVRDKEKERARSLGVSTPKTSSGFAVIPNDIETASDADDWNWLGKTVGLDAIRYRNTSGDHAAFIPLLGWLAKHTRRSETAAPYGEPDV